jgi:hypothetical protein
MFGELRCSCEHRRGFVEMNRVGYKPALFPVSICHRKETLIPRLG